MTRAWYISGYDFLKATPSLDTEWPTYWFEWVFWIQTILLSRGRQIHVSISPYTVVELYELRLYWLNWLLLHGQFILLRIIDTFYMGSEALLYPKTISLYTLISWIGSSSTSPSINLYKSTRFCIPIGLYQTCVWVRQQLFVYVSHAINEFNTTKWHK